MPYLLGFRVRVQEMGNKKLQDIGNTFNSGQLRIE